jgi:hypothetical protein
MDFDLWKNNGGHMGTPLFCPLTLSSETLGSTCSQGELKKNCEQFGGNLIPNILPKTNLVSSCHQIVHKKLFKNKMVTKYQLGINLHVTK